MMRFIRMVQVYLVTRRAKIDVERDLGYYKELAEASAINALWSEIDFLIGRAERGISRQVKTGNELSMYRGKILGLEDLRNRIKRAPKAVERLDRFKKEK